VCVPLQVAITADALRVIRVCSEYQILKDGKLAGVGKHSYSEGNTTKGHHEAAKFKAGK
jgi:hypothetical protein